MAFIRPIGGDWETIQRDSHTNPSSWTADLRRPALQLSTESAPPRVLQFSRAFTAFRHPIPPYPRSNYRLFPLEHLFSAAIRRVCAGFAQEAAARQTIKVIRSLLVTADGVE